MNATRPASQFRQFIVLLFLAAGVQFWIGIGRAELGERRQLLAAATAVILAIAAMVLRPLREKISELSIGIAHPSRLGKIITTLAIMLLSCGYLYASARFQHRDFSPILHDEYAYLLQAKMLAGGHLWLPKHELSDFFETFHVVTDRVYAAKYGPGTAMFYAIGVWMHWPASVMPLILSGVCVGLLYLLMTELFDGTSGWLAAILLVSLGIFRRTSIMVMSQAPMLMLVLLAMLAFIYWRREKRLFWMVGIGIAVGWGAITRPVDAVCIAMPLALGVVFELWKLPNRQRPQTIIAGLLACAPFLALQLVYNKGVTGKFSVLPWSYYAQRYDPYDSLGRKPIDETFRPISVVPQVQQFYDEFTVPEYRKKLGMSRAQGIFDRAAKTLAGLPLAEQDRKRLIYGALPSPVLIVLLPVGLLGLCHRRWALWLGLPIFILLYASYTFFLPHYAVAIVPAIILMLLAGKAVFAKSLSRGPHLQFALSTAILVTSLMALPELNPARRDQVFDASLLRKVDEKLAEIPGQAIVLFKFDSDRNLHEEPVYNVETAWPDDARIIRAHDLGFVNSKLLAYYAAQSPARTVYRFDEKDESLTHLGTVTEALKRAQQSAASQEYPP